MANTKKYKLTYSELIQFDSYGDRLDYLILLDGNVDSPRHMSNTFYKSPEWLATREAVIVRDLGRDLGCRGFDITGKIIVHHINPITEDDILNNDPKLYDLENLICVSVETHNIIHYGLKNDSYVERTPNDTTLWRI